MPTNAAGALPPVLLPGLEATSAPTGDPALFEQLLGAAVGREGAAPESVLPPTPAPVSPELPVDPLKQELLETLPMPSEDAEAPLPTQDPDETAELPRWVPPSGEWSRPTADAPSAEADEFHVPTEPSLEPALPTMEMLDDEGAEAGDLLDPHTPRPAAIDGAPGLVVRKSSPGAATPKPAFASGQPAPPAPQEAPRNPFLDVDTPQEAEYVAQQDASADASSEPPPLRSPAARVPAPRFRTRVRPVDTPRVDAAADAPMTAEAVDAPESPDLPDGLRTLDVPEFEHQGSFKLAGVRGARVSVDLGDGEVVRAKVSVAEGEVDVHLRATDEAASRAERRLGELKEALDEKGLKLARFTVDAEEQERKERRQRRQRKYDNQDEARGGFFNRRA